MKSLGIYTTENKVIYQNLSEGVSVGKEALITDFILPKGSFLRGGGGGVGYQLDTGEKVETGCPLQGNDQEKG